MVRFCHLGRRLWGEFTSVAERLLGFLLHGFGLLQGLAHRSLLALTFFRIGIFGNRAGLYFCLPFI